jgi:HSP20 family molecular chaperone IbpA
MVETVNEFRFYLSIPGLIEDDLLIELEGQFLTIRGERHPPYDAQTRGASIQEWRYGFFERHFELSTLIEVNSLRAAYDAGVLTIVAAKQDPDQPSKSDFASDDSDEAQL